MRPPPEFRVIEVRMDSFLPTAEAQTHPLGGVPSPLTLQAQRPMLLARCQDERLYVYRLQAQAAADGSGSASGLCLRRQPLDWLRYAALTASGMHACMRARLLPLQMGVLARTLRAWCRHSILRALSAS